MRVSMIEELDISCKRILYCLIKEKGNKLFLKSNAFAANGFVQKFKLFRKIYHSEWTLLSN